MDGAAVFRLISLIPDRVPRAQTGSPFDGAALDQAELLCRFLGWLGPLNPVSKEDQQLLGVRAGGGRALAESDEIAEDLEETPLTEPGAGPQIAA